MYYGLRYPSVITLGLKKTIFYVEPPKEIRGDDDDTFLEYSGKTDKNYMGRTMLQHVLPEASGGDELGFYVPCSAFEFRGDIIAGRVQELQVTYPVTTART